MASRASKWSADRAHVCRAIEKCALKLGLSHLSRLTANLLRPVPIRDLTIEVITNYVGRNSGHFSARLKRPTKRLRTSWHWPNVRTM